MGKFLLHKSEFLWVLPFVFLALCALTLARPQRTIPPIAEGRAVADGGGEMIILPEPFPGVVSDRNGSNNFLLATNSVEALLKAGGPRDRPKLGSSLPVRVFPRLAEDGALWDMPSDLESILGRDVHGVYLGGGDLRRYGFTTINNWPSIYVPEDKESAVFTMTRVWNDVIGRREQADRFFARYMREYADLTEELKPESFRERPGVMNVISSADDWTSVFYTCSFDKQLDLPDVIGSYGVTGRYSEAERVLAINPEIIIAGRADFLRDPRWRGLRAVRDNRVYERPQSDLGGWTFALNRPLYSWWVAEVAYPDRLRPRVRALIREHYRENYGYLMGDDELDDLLSVRENHDTPVGKRFLRSDVTYR